MHHSENVRAPVASPPGSYDFSQSLVSAAPELLARSDTAFAVAKCNEVLPAAATAQRAACSDTCGAVCAGVHFAQGVAVRGVACDGLAHHQRGHASLVGAAAAVDAVAALCDAVAEGAGLRAETGGSVEAGEPPWPP